MVQYVDADPWKRVKGEQKAFYEEQMASVLELYHEGKPAEALKRLDEVYDKVDEEHPSHHFFAIVWWEAQVKSGREDAEWGYQVFNSLYERSIRKNPRRAVDIPSSDYVLYQNIIARLSSLGRAAEVRSWVLKMEDSLRDFKGINTEDTSVYADRGAIFSFMPEARKRAFPYYRKDLGQGSDLFIYYANMYAVISVADQALFTGDWARAAELYYWYIGYSNVYIENDGGPMPAEVYKYTLRAIKSLMLICEIHGHTEESLGFYQHYVEQIEKFFTKQRPFYSEGYLRRELAKMEFGQLDEESLSIADEAMEVISSTHYYDKDDVIECALLRARIYYALGRKPEAWEMVNTVFEEAKKDVNPNLWTYVLTTVVDLAIEDGATDPQIEDWLLLALDNERQKGNKFGELPLYEKYAIFLEKQGSYAEAIEILQEAVRLAGSMRLPTRVLENRKEIERLQLAQQVVSDRSDKGAQELAGNAAEHGAFESGASEVRNPERTIAFRMVDIQPIQSAAISVSGEKAYGRFFVLNSSSEEQTGMLRVRGAVGEIQMLDDGWYVIESGVGMTKGQSEIALSLGAGESVVIEISGEPEAGGTESLVTCEWIGASGDGVSAQWRYSSAAKDERTAVIDAHRVRDNPFFLIPIHHMIQRSSAGEPEAIDLRIESSVPMRIEIYDAQSNELISIDANGDGDFKDQGDYIGVDVNRNNWPDLSFEADQKLTSLVMYVKGAEGTTDSEAQLTVKVLDDGEWRIDAVDHVQNL
ncbi:tetratricopeptide repeat protein [Rubritalea spongiae]|uniref:Tetratricopeptide repeat protein n=1 Tax=Rubritalea spongiae TaxID=430797 RepID=A0ABW5E2J1_9BACT